MVGGVARIRRERAVDRPSDRSDGNEGDRREGCSFEASLTLGTTPGRPGSGPAAVAHAAPQYHRMGSLVPGTAMGAGRGRSATMVEGQVQTPAQEENDLQRSRSHGLGDRLSR